MREHGDAVALLRDTWDRRHPARRAVRVRSARSELGSGENGRERERRLKKAQVFYLLGVINQIGYLFPGARQAQPSCFCTAMPVQELP